MRHVFRFQQAVEALLCESAFGKDEVIGAAGSDSFEHPEAAGGIAERGDGLRSMGRGRGDPRPFVSRRLGLDDQMPLVFPSLAGRRRSRRG